MKGIIGKTKVFNKGKGSKSEMLPSRSAMTQLTRGDPAQRTIGQYAKKTPSMYGASAAYARCGGKIR
jgi:hypothetical protein